ncbi:MAPEG family protein [Kineobactrum salinum]|uniref:MAPEG family protein n=1 Tax=Kineobactrum salinum TaxID=2708301 RepID=A0A6C0U6M4_9GAMM|nr:MAPEG family protein [Kineobactrum salinum]QIB66085.1 MAPEG family protein [Kineobactrum salinum]
MALVALVTVLLLAQYFAFLSLCGAQRARAGVMAPAVTGNEGFERAYRVQMNTLEQLVITLPALWLSAIYFDPPWVAAGLGLLFLMGRQLYRHSYVRDPARRGPGMIIGALANAGLLLTALWGIVPRLPGF